MLPVRCDVIQTLDSQHAHEVIFEKAPSMTSVSSQAPIPSQASNTTSAQSAPSYASQAKKGVSSPPIATGSSTPSPAVAVGGSAPAQQHGKTNSISPVNGKPSISPAVPVVSAPAIAHSSSAINGGATDHSRKSSVTINANGPSNMNGGPVGGSKGIQFGAMGGASPAASPAQPAASAPMPIPNPRVTDPSHSPTPIPAPSASGGRPPSIVGQGNGVAFGSFGGDGDVSFFFAFAPQPRLIFCFTASHATSIKHTRTFGARKSASRTSTKGIIAVYTERDEQPNWC